MPSSELERADNDAEDDDCSSIYYKYYINIENGVASLSPIAVYIK